MNMDALQDELHNINEGQHQQDRNPFRQYPNQEEHEEIDIAENEAMDENGQNQEINNEAGIENEQNEQQQRQQQDRGDNNRGGRGRRRRPYRAGNPAKRALYKKRNSHYEQAIDTWAKMQAKQIIALSNEFKKNGSRRSN